MQILTSLLTSSSSTATPPTRQQLHTTVMCHKDSTTRATAPTATRSNYKSACPGRLPPCLVRNQFAGLKLQMQRNLRRGIRPSLLTPLGHALLNALDQHRHSKTSLSSSLSSTANTPTPFSHSTRSQARGSSVPIKGSDLVLCSGFSQREVLEASRRTRPLRQDSTTIAPKNDFL